MIGSEKEMRTEQVNILGNKIDCFPDYRTFFEAVMVAMKKGEARGYVTVNNVHTMVEGFRNAAYQTIINEGYLAIPDGKPLEVVGKLKGSKTISRLFGPTVMEKFIDWGRSEKVSHFFLGSSEENLAKLRSSIEQKYPGAKIAGMLSPPYLPLEQWDNKALTDAINAADPDFIWVGVGAPKQEQWMYRNHPQLQRGLMFGIGAGFDYMAGNTKHAPKWMKDFALEWLYRLIQEPRRLWKRYFTTIPQFIFFASLELMGVKFRSKRSS